MMLEVSHKLADANQEKMSLKMRQKQWMNCQTLELVVHGVIPDWSPPFEGHRKPLSTYQAPIRHKCCLDFTTTP